MKAATNLPGFTRKTAALKTNKFPDKNRVTDQARPITTKYNVSPRAAAAFETPKTKVQSAGQTAFSLSPKAHNKPRTMLFSSSNPDLVT